MKYLLYFLVGGFTVTVVTYISSHGKGLFAAFVANMPVITFITFLTIYFTSGQEAVLSYAKGLLIMLFPWLAYIFAVVFLSPNLSLLPSLAIGILLYLSIAYIILTRIG